uniref:VPS13_C domain-containing protein n=1 Tax=Soboliphyme baturini TaxID=241478 RepID=A0A183IKA9_9BILA
GFDKALHELKPDTFVHFYWESLLSDREFVWSCDTKENVSQNLSKDFASSFISSRGTNVYWVSFLDGRQRVLLFTEDLAVATIAQQAYELERCDLQLTASFQGIGLSLVDNRVPAELAYVAIISSGIIWECKKKRFKAMSIKECRNLEAAYAKYLNEREVSKNKSVYVADKMTVDFESMQQVKPHKREIRRSFQTGFWMQYKSSPHDVQLHMKINYFQIDNQLSGCVFPTVFSPFPLPKSVASESIPKPFVEVSFIMRTGEHSTIPHIEYFKVLVQEMALKADQGFVNAMLSFLMPENQSEFAESKGLEQDMLVVNQDVKAVALISSSTGQKSFYNILHFSPIKLHLSYSQGGASTEINQPIPAFSSEFFGLLLKSVGVTVTEIQDVVFKLAYFEKEAVFLSQSQLISEVVNHYVKQAVKQIYVLVLGLDIIGNPFGLIRDLSSGVETLFYEPIQGAIQGPEEFVEGLALGVRSLFGHTVGGAAGAVSRITGTLGKGIAALTMDDEYQKKRQEMMNRRQGDFASGIVQGGRGLVMVSLSVVPFRFISSFTCFEGVVEGVTGVFTKPVEGAREEGVIGFMKGLGKGLIGAVARPVSGAVDFASSSFEAVRKVADVSAEVKHIRPSRFILPDKIVRPYLRAEAEGNTMLRVRKLGALLLIVSSNYTELEKGKFMHTDIYVADASLAKDNSSYFFVTDRLKRTVIACRRILFASKNDIMSSYSVEWEHVYSDFNPPTQDKNDLVVMLKEKKKKQVFGKSISGRRITFLNEESARIKSKEETVFLSNSESTDGPIVTGKQNEDHNKRKQVNFARTELRVR